MIEDYLKGQVIIILAIYVAASTIVASHKSEREMQ